MSWGLIVAAPRSGSGKTTITLALLAALRRRGVAVRAAKSGPDYIDPGYHAAACGQPSTNLDSWAMPGPALGGAMARACADCDLLVIESAMGLFDGADQPAGARGNAADLAARYDLPVLLVLDVSGQSHSAAAVARGFAMHEAGVRVAGVIANRIGSPRHLAQVAGALAACGLPVLGHLPRDPALGLPERHLGLVLAEEQPELAARLACLADRATACFDLDAITALARPIRASAGSPLLPPPGQRIAIARDAAFAFVYPHVLQGWRDRGAEIVPFSPLADEAPDDTADCCWLPGGYPELHAAPLAAAQRFQTGLRRFAQTRPVHGECGGYMVLGARLQDAEGQHHAMAGLLDHTTSFARRKLHLGYRAARLRADGPLGPAGTRLRGHEFHYASVTDPGSDTPLAELQDATGTALGMAGGQRGRVSGSFFHAMAQIP